MLKLSGKPKSSYQVDSGIYQVSTDKNLPEVLKKSRCYFVENEEIPEGYNFYLATDEKKSFIPDGKRFVEIPNDFSYIKNNDIIRFYENDSFGVIFRADSNHNSFLVTEQCNHYCLMCSQPPRKVDDKYLLDEIRQAIPLIPRDTKEIGFTGGEPTLFGDDFLDILRLTKNYLPETSIHILSNGRAFVDHQFVKNYASINHHDMMVGIPLYSDDPKLHDYIVQAQGAFDETILGILNLKKLNQKVEIRIVLHKQSIKRLKELCEYIVRNLLFVDHVALMGLEMMGFTRGNLEELWIDPYEYKDLLSDSVGILENARMNISIYNHQLCLVNQDVYPNYRKSISDWKNEYEDECEKCSKLQECGGFFSSGLKYKKSEYIQPFSS